MEKSRLKFKIGEIEFEAEGDAEVILRERNAFMQYVLPAAVDAVVKTGIARNNESYIDVKENNIQLIEDEQVTSEIGIDGGKEVKYSRMNLASFIQEKGFLTEQDFVLFAAYFDEKKKGKEYFTKDDVDSYYVEARRKKSSNISMSLNQLAGKGYIMDAENVEQKKPKPYIVSSEGIKYVESYTPKEKIDNKTPIRRTGRKETKKESQYADLDLDELNLDKYIEVKNLKNFKDKMILLMYILTNEEKGEWFATTDILCIMTDIFGEPATMNQINGVFNREKMWFKSEKIEGVTKRKLLSPAKEYVKVLISK